MLYKSTTLRFRRKAGPAQFSVIERLHKQVPVFIKRAIFGRATAFALMSTVESWR
jgi:hypothetical protein